jgi:ABC-type transporter Mla subunit MlaD
MARSQNWKVGLFVLTGVLLLVMTIMLMIGVEINKPRDRYKIRFDESVSGLEAGSAVRYRGVLVGTVDRILIPKDDITKVEVQISVEKDMPIKTDTKAMLSRVGITGLQYIELLAGTAESPRLPPGSFIPAQLSVFGSLTGTAQGAAEKLDLLLANLLYITDREKVDKLIGEVSTIMASVRESTGRAQEVLAAATRASNRADTLAINLNDLLVRNEEHLDSLIVNLDATTAALNRTFAEIERTQLVANAGATSAAVRDVAEDLREILGIHRRTVSETLVNLRETSANLNEFSRVVRNQPSLLLRSSPAEEPNIPGVK